MDDAIKNKSGVLDHRTEVELQHQLASEYGQDGPKSKDWQAIKDQIWSDPLRGIINGSGDVSRDEMGHKWIRPADYGNRDADAVAKNLFDAGDATFYFNKDDYQKMDRALENKSPAEIQQMDQEFKTKYGTSMEDYIKDRFSNHKDERDKALKLLHTSQQGDDQAAA